MKISQQNQHLADVVELNAEHELRKFRRHIRDHKYMLVNISQKIKYINSIKALENAPTELVILQSFDLDIWGRIFQPGSNEVQETISLSPRI